MLSIKCAFVAITRTVEIKATKGGKDYLSLEAFGGVDGEDRFWIATFSGIDDLLEKIKPDTKVYVEGTEKIRLSADGKPFRAISASLIVPLFEIEAKPKSRAAPARPRQETKPETDILAAGRAAPAAAAQMYDRPFDDNLPF